MASGTSDGNGAGPASERGGERAERVFDARILKEPLSVLPQHTPLCFSRDQTVSEAMHAMQKEHRGCVLVTYDGTPGSPLTGIFTERDVLFRIVDRGRNPATLPLKDVMTADPERVKVSQPIGAVLHMMSVGGFRHIPVVDEENRPVFVVSVKDVVQFLVDAFPREILNLAAPLPTGSQKERDGA